jgi:hypothetical protein
MGIGDFPDWLTVRRGRLAVPFVRTWGRERVARWVMANSPTDAPLLLWLTPSLLALLLYGLGQGFVKMWITEVPPARFCLHFACAGALVMGLKAVSTHETRARCCQSPRGVASTRRFWAAIQERGDMRYMLF